MRYACMAFAFAVMKGGRSRRAAPKAKISATTAPAAPPITAVFQFSVIDVFT